MFDIKEQIKNLPEKPGVYIMKDAERNIIYIGKAKVLKNRVRQYFQTSHAATLKVQSMVANIREFEYIVTDSELEALVLECNLIKKHKPRYNILLKDDKHYPYIKVTINEEYPRVIFTRKIIKDGAKYFGPYTNTQAVRETIDLIKKIFAIRGCEKTSFRDYNNGRPCLNYHIKQCLAPCQGKIGKESYNRIIEDVLSFLSGKQEVLIKKLTRDMYLASENMDFERAAGLRDKINSLNKIAERQKVISTSFSDQDIIAFAEDDDLKCFQIFFVRGGKLIGTEHFMIEDVVQTEKSELFSTFIKQFYNDAPYVPKEIILKEELDDVELIQMWLSEKRSSKVSIRVPQKGEKRKLVNMVEQNANEALRQHRLKVKDEKNYLMEALNELKESLELKTLPKRIESYDISNTSGSESVGVMVVFENGRPNNKEYRRYKIKSVSGPNDYESIKEVLYRRLKHIKFQDETNTNSSTIDNKQDLKTVPDLLLIDGGKGHVNSAKSVLIELEINIPVYGMVKDEKHKTRALTNGESEVNMQIGKSLFKFITSIQDEVHRFAISYHRNLRFKRNVRSELEDIKGIGISRRKNLMMHFKSIDKIKKATIEELMLAKGMNKASAIEVYEHFR